MTQWIRWQYLRAIGVLLIVFILGAVFGGLATGLFVKRMMHTFSNPPAMSQLIFNRLNSSLALKPEQKERIRPLCEKLAQDIAQKMTQASEERKNFILQAEAEIAPELSPEQRVKLHKMVEERIQKIH